MLPTDLATKINDALSRANKSQRQIADETGISQSGLSRMISGQKTPTIPELISITETTGHTLDQLTGNSIAERLEVAVHSTNSCDMTQMCSQLIYFLELDAYLDDQAIPTE